MNPVPVCYLLLSSLLSGSLCAQDGESRYKYFDVKDYSFRIELNDSSDIIYGIAGISISILQKTDTLYLDLANLKEDGNGMQVDAIVDENGAVNYFHRMDRIAIPASGFNEKQVKNYTITYHGIPADGLIISNNKFGDRTFFGDNWPNRAHQWLPCIDHPADKASLEFTVKAPSHYKVVSNGTCYQETISDNSITSSWRTTAPLPTKLMVIGVADFAINELSVINGVPVSSWVYPQNKTEGFTDYAVAIKPLLFYSRLIGPFPFSKLANVQSTTLYGGMENASCIFYAENTVSGKNLAEGTIAHEISHQWFGDAVTEKDWYHIWLSEGFASYLTGMYIEDTYGRSAFLNYLNRQRNRVFDYEKIHLSPLIDTSLSVSDDLLNSNTYQKASWVLHMLRKEIGDSLFTLSLQKFYKEFEYKNAVTDDFRNVVENLSGRDFKDFFEQWLYGKGHPIVEIRWEYQEGELILNVKQTQKSTIFTFPLEIKIINKNSGSDQLVLDITDYDQAFQFKYHKHPLEIIADPGNWILMESVINP